MGDMKTFGVMLFEGFEVLDVFGPLEAFGILAYDGKCRVVTVAERAGAVTSAQGPKVIADFGFTESGFNDCPPIDILLKLNPALDRARIQKVRSRAPAK